MAQCCFMGTGKSTAEQRESDLIAFRSFDPFFPIGMHHLLHSPDPGHGF